MSKGPAVRSGALRRCPTRFSSRLEVGTPRNTDRMNDAFTALKLAAGADLVAVALEAGVISVEQGKQIEAVWADHLQG